MSIHSKVRKVREYKGITRQEMADFLDISLSGYSKIEQGKVEVSINKFEKIAEYLGVDNYELSRARTDEDIACILKQEPVEKKEDNTDMLKQIKRQDQLIELLQKEINELRRENRILISENNKLLNQDRRKRSIE